MNTSTMMTCDELQDWAREQIQAEGSGAGNARVGHAVLWLLQTGWLWPDDAITDQLEHLGIDPASLNAEDLDELLCTYVFDSEVQEEAFVTKATLAQRFADARLSRRFPDAHGNCVDPYAEPSGRRLW